MLRLYKSRTLKIITLLIALTFIPAQISWAGPLGGFFGGTRGRRGENATTDLVISAVGGAAQPLTTRIAGPNAAYFSLLSTGINFGLTEAGVDPHTASLILAATTATVGGVSGAAAAGQSGGQAVVTVVKSVVRRVAAAEVSYQLQQAGLGPLALLASGLTDLALGSVMAGGVPPQAGERLVKVLIRGGIYAGVRYALDSALDKRSPARAYADNIAVLGAQLAENAAENIKIGDKSILPKRITYKVKEKIGTPADFQPAGAKKLADMPEDFRKRLEDDEDGIVYRFKETKDGIKVTKYELKGDSVFISEAIHPDITPRQLQAWIEKGYLVIADSGTGETQVLQQYGTGPVFIWSAKSAMKDMSDAEKREFVERQRGPWPWETSYSFEPDAKILTIGEKYGLSAAEFISGRSFGKYILDEENGRFFERIDDDLYKDQRGKIYVEEEGSLFGPFDEEINARGIRNIARMNDLTLKELFAGMHSGRYVPLQDGRLLTRIEDGLYKDKIKDQVFIRAGDNFARIPDKLLELSREKGVPPIKLFEGLRKGDYAVLDDGRFLSRTDNSLYRDEQNQVYLREGDKFGQVPAQLLSIAKENDLALSRLISGLKQKEYAVLRDGKLLSRVQDDLYRDGNDRLYRREGNNFVRLPAGARPQPALPKQKQPPARQPKPEPKEKAKLPGTESDDEFRLAWGSLESSDTQPIPAITPLLDDIRRFTAKATKLPDTPSALPAPIEPIRERMNGLPYGELNIGDRVTFRDFTGQMQEGEVVDAREIMAGTDKLKEVVVRKLDDGTIRTTSGHLDVTSEYKPLTQPAISREEKKGIVKDTLEMFDRLGYLNPERKGFVKSWLMGEEGN